MLWPWAPISPSCLSHVDCRSLGRSRPCIAGQFELLLMGNQRTHVQLLSTQASELAPFLPAVATELLPSISSRLISRISARVVRDLYVD